jgi:hypothetical protein
MSGLSSGYNLPPGVYDNDPHFTLIKREMEDQGW